MNGTRFQQKAPFSVPVSEKCTQDDWESIFGTEEERKAKLAKAIEEQKAAKKAAREGDITFPQIKCGGGTDAGKVAIQGGLDMVEQSATSAGLPPEAVKTAKKFAAAEAERMASLPPPGQS